MIIKIISCYFLWLFFFFFLAIQDLRPSVSQSLVQLELVVRSHEKVESCLRNKVLELEDEKVFSACRYLIF